MRILASYNQGIKVNAPPAGRAGKVAEGNPGKFRRGDENKFIIQLPI